MEVRGGCHFVDIQNLLSTLVHRSGNNVGHNNDFTGGVPKIIPNGVKYPMVFSDRLVSRHVEREEGDRSTPYHKLRGYAFARDLLMADL